MGAIVFVGGNDTVGAGVGAHRVLVHEIQVSVLPYEMVPEAHAVQFDPSYYSSSAQTHFSALESAKPSEFWNM